jgi:hypothetical protein
MGPQTLVEALRGLYGRVSRPVRRLAWVLFLTPVLLLAISASAHADSGSNAPASLGWIKIRDSHDIDIWKYELSLDRGGITDTGKTIWSFVTELMWGLYLLAMSIAIWFIDWALSFSWLDVIISPVVRIGDALAVVVDRLGVAPTLLTITAVAAVLWMAKGKWVLGIFELFLSMIIASLAVGVLANPVSLVAGPDGLLYNSRDVGLEIASGLANEGDTSGSPDQVRKDVTAMMADTFIRQPAQIINFGAVLDGGKCEDDYTDVVSEGPYGDGDEIREAVADCDSDYGEVAENPNSGMAMSAVSLVPAALITMLFAAVLSGAVIVAGLYALYNALKLIVTLLAGMLPGGGRGALWMTVADLVISLVTLVFSVVFLGAFLMLIQAVFASGDEENRMQTFFIVDALLLAGLVVFWKGRKRLKAAADRLAQAMAKRPGGGGPTSLPPRSTFNPAEIYYKGRMALGAARVANAALGRGDTATAVPAAGSQSPAAPGAPRYGRTSVNFGSEVTDPSTATVTATRVPATGSAAASTQTGSSSAGRVLERVHGSQARRKTAAGVLMRTGATVVAAAATGGTSAVAQTLGRQAATRAVGATVRRAALTARLRPEPLALAAGGSGAGARSTSSGPSGPGGPGGPGTLPRSSTGVSSRAVTAAAGQRHPLALGAAPSAPATGGAAPASTAAPGQQASTPTTIPTSGALPRPKPATPTSSSSQATPQAHAPARPSTARAIALPGPTGGETGAGAGQAGVDDRDDAARRLRARLEGRRTPPALRQPTEAPSRRGPNRA